MLMDFVCTLSFAKLFQSRMTLAAKSSNAPLWLPEYITSNCDLECTGFETAGAFFFVGIKDSAHPGLID